MDLLTDPRFFARLTVTTTALTTRALANGNRIVVRVNQQLCWLHPDGRCTPIDAQIAQTTQNTPDISTPS